MLNMQELWILYKGKLLHYSSMEIQGHLYPHNYFNPIKHTIPTIKNQSSVDDLLNSILSVKRYQIKHRNTMEGEQNKNKNVGGGV